jgi:putative addiction module killer protein
MAFSIALHPVFEAWLMALRDDRGRKRIVQRLAIVEGGSLGDAKSVGDGVSEMRLHIGPGYRLYFTRRGGELVILLCGGDKDSQDRDIRQAKRLASELEA